MRKFFKTSLPLLGALLLLLGSSLPAAAQQTVKGTVFDTDRSATLAGATVQVQGKNVFAVTDLDGKFTIAAAPGDVLLVQFIGYKDGRANVTNAASYDIILAPDREVLEEVIVTALGMKREKRSLGYAATDVSGENLTAVQNSNWLSSLQGKVAGLQFNSDVLKNLRISLVNCC